MIYLVLIEDQEAVLSHVGSNLEKLSRTFTTLRSAIDYVSSLHSKSWDARAEDFKNGYKWDGALLFKAGADGRTTLLDYYSTESDGKGGSVGWTTGFLKETAA